MRKRRRTAAASRARRRSATAERATPLRSLARGKMGTFADGDVRPRFPYEAVGCGEGARARRDASSKDVADREPGTSNGVVLRGILRDDVGAPVPNSHVTISIHGEGGTAGPPFPSRAQSAAASGLAPEAHDPHIAPDEYVVDTDASGVVLHPQRLVLRTRRRCGFVSREALSSSASDDRRPFRSRPTPVASIAFEPEPRVVSLDRPTYAQGMRVVARVARGSRHVTLRDERQKCARRGRRRRRRLCAHRSAYRGARRPRRGRSFRRAPRRAASPAITHAVERHARVMLELESPRAFGYPDDGFAVAVRARSVTRRRPDRRRRNHHRRSAGRRGARASRPGGGRRALRCRSRHDGRGSAALPARHALVGTRRPARSHLHIRPPSAWRRAPLFVLALALAAVDGTRAAPRAAAHAATRARTRRALRRTKRDASRAGARRERRLGGTRHRRARRPTSRAGQGVRSSCRRFPAQTGRRRRRGDDGDERERPLRAARYVVPCRRAPSRRSAAARDVRRSSSAAGRARHSPGLATPAPSRTARAVVGARMGSRRSCPTPRPHKSPRMRRRDVIGGDVRARERADRVKSWARAVDAQRVTAPPSTKRPSESVVSREPRPRGRSWALARAPRRRRAKTSARAPRTGRAELPSTARHDGSGRVVVRSRASHAGSTAAGRLSIVRAPQSGALRSG